MIGRTIYVSVLILMLSHKTSAGGCRSANPCSHRPRPTTPKLLVETVKPTHATTAINNVNSTMPGVVNEGSTEQIPKENFTTTSTTMASSTNIALSTTATTQLSTSTELPTTTELPTSIELSTTTEASITIEPSTSMEPSISIEPSTTMVPSTATKESSEMNTESTDNEDSTSASSITEEFSTTEVRSIAETQSSEPPCESSTNSDIEKVKGNKGGPIAKCPEQNGLKAVFVADSKDCSVFYMCNWGQAKKIKCPGGLYFNSKLNVCDWPVTADCKVG